ncbi:growth/differentiation factor 8 [Patella vulgata]|uniref:growth/differentiation factor 8 n=1 Tax=Patella vulgata TaxID=6465 RepID=UPI002180809E|nr:growth/differentiation factor 8 [Patella vulgata]
MVVVNIPGFSLKGVIFLLSVSNLLCSHISPNHNRTYYKDLTDLSNLVTVTDDTEKNLEDYVDNKVIDDTETIMDDALQYNETFSANQTFSNTTQRNCSQCVTRQRDKRMRMELIKQQILTKLHFKTLPNMTAKVLPKIPSISSLLARFTEDMQGDSPYRTHDYEEYDDDHDFYGRVDRVYTVGKPVPDELGIPNKHGCYFKMPDEVQNVRIRMAILWFYVKQTVPQSTAIEMRVHKICPPSMKCGHNNTVRIHYKKHIPSYKKGNNWHRVDIRHLVHKWINYPEMNYGLVLTAFDHDGRNLVVTPSIEDSENHGYEPILEFETVELKKRRPKRSIALVCTDNTNEQRCCRYPLEVDFVDFGWDWVIAPMRYKADYCSGECQSTYQDEHAHAYLRQYASPTSDGPCCTPTKLQPISLLYFDHNHNILYTDLKNMKVMKCGCA